MSNSFNLLRGISPSRSFATTAATRFFFNRPDPNSPSVLLQELLQAQRNGRLDTFNRVYPKLIDSLRAKPNQTKIEPTQFRGFMRFVAQSSRASLIVRMFQDLKWVGYDPEGVDHNLLLLGLTRSSKVDKALKWIQSMRETYGVTPTCSDWNLVIAGYRRVKDFNSMQEVLNVMRGVGISPDVVSYNTVIAGLFDAGDMAGIEVVRAMMEKSGVVADLYTETTLLNGYAAAKDLLPASAAHTRLRLLLDQVRPASVGHRELSALNALVSFATLESGYLAATLLAEKFREQGFPLDAHTMNILAKGGIGGIVTAEEGGNFVQELERVTGITSDRYTWGIVISNVLAGSNGLDEGLKLYQEARSRNISPDAPMVQPLLDALLQDPTPATFRIAKNLYEDLVAGSKDYRLGPDASIFITLLKACAHPSIKDLDYSSTLLNDMRERGLRLEKHSVTQHIITLMRVAPSWTEAFKAYDIVRALDVSALDTLSYNTIIAAFASLPFLDPITSIRESAPRAIVHEFLTDMRRSAHPPSVGTYTLLLDYYSKCPSQNSTSSAIAHLHSLIKLDQTIDPDTALFNALMNAYSRVGAYNTALRIWESMKLNPYIGIDHITLSILFDTVGYMNTDESKLFGKKVWRELNEEGNRIGMNLKSVESYLEALSRWGEHEEAERIAFEEMGIGSKIVARHSTFETLLKFSLRDGESRWVALRERIQKERPELWEGLKEVALFRSSGKVLQE